MTKNYEFLPPQNHILFENQALLFIDFHFSYFFDSNILILHYLKFSISLNCIQVMTERMQLFYEGVTGKGINMLDSV